MLAWNKGEKGKAARQKWYEARGAELRAPGTKRYSEDKARDAESIAKAAKHRNEWTAKEESTLLEMAGQGKTAKEIAAKISRSIRGVERKREKLKKSNVELTGGALFAPSGLSAGLEGETMEHENNKCKNAAEL